MGNVKEENCPEAYLLEDSKRRQESDTVYLQIIYAYLNASLWDVTG